MNNLMNKLSDQEEMNKFFQEFAQKQDRKKRRRKKNKNSSRASQEQAAEEARQDAEARAERERRRHHEKYLAAQKKLKEENEALVRKLAQKKAVTSLIPDDADEMARLFILAEIFGKPPPGLS